MLSQTLFTMQQCTQNFFMGKGFEIKFLLSGVNDVTTGGNWPQPPGTEFISKLLTCEEETLESNYKCAGLEC